MCMKWPQFESALKCGSSNIDSNKEMSREVVPSGNVLDTIKQLGSIADGHETVLDNIQTLQVPFSLITCCMTNQRTDQLTAINVILG